jgi:serine/threonine protein kinase
MSTSNPTSSGANPGPRTQLTDAEIKEILARVPPLAPPRIADLFAAPPPTTVNVLVPHQRPFALPKIGDRITCAASGSTYTIGSYLGQGNFSVVFKGTDDFDNDVAIKVLKPSGTYEEDRAAAVGEFERLRALRHHKITHVHDAFEFQGSFYIVTEWCGMTLGSVISQSYMADCIQGVARCVLHALTFIHNNGMVYLDLHLNNVFFAWGRNEFARDELAGPTFKIGDLGVTKPESEITPAATLANWMLPPEAIDPDEFGPMDRRIDVYHAGLLLLQLVLGRRLEFTRQEILDGVPRQMALQLVDPYQAALEKALRRHVQFRTPTARELYQDLQRR